MKTAQSAFVPNSDSSTASVDPSDQQGSNSARFSAVYLEARLYLTLMIKSKVLKAVQIITSTLTSVRRSEGKWVCSL